MAKATKIKRKYAKKTEQVKPELKKQVKPKVNKDGKTKKQVDKEKLLEQLKNIELKSKAQALFRSAYDSRERYDWEWLTRDLFRRGYHFSTYNADSKTVLLTSGRKVKIPINLLWAQMRSVKNQVTNFKPKWEVLPTGKTEESVNNARYSGRLLDYYYSRLNLRKMLKEVVMQGLLFSVGGPLQIGYDPNADNGDGEVYAWLIDPYDFYVDPNATSLEDAEYVVKAVRKTLSEITTNEEYNFYDAIPEKGDSILAASPSKQFLKQALRHRGGTTKEEEEEGAILKEAWIKVRVSDDNVKELKEELTKNDEDTKDLRIGEILMRTIHYVDFINDPLKVQLKRMDELPFVMYQADINPCELYGESWAKHIIPINKMLNALEGSVFMYNYRYAIGRIVIDKNSGVRLISNQHGDFIEKNRGAEVTSLPLAPLPNSYQTQIESCRRYIEDLGGSHEVSMGRLPAQIKSGIAIAELKQADSTNQGDLVDNLEDFMVQVGKKILKVVAKNYEVPKVIKDLGMGGDIKHFAAVGETGSKRKNKRSVKIGVDNFDLAIIGADNEIRVTIGSWLAYTKTARQERIKELFDAKLIDQKTALQHLEFSDVDDIIESTRKEQVLSEMRSSQATGAGSVTDEEIARQENKMMVQEGIDVPVEVTDNHSVHNIVHQEALGIVPNELLEKHMSIHEELARKHGPRGQQPSPEEAVGQRMTTPQAPIPTPGMAGMPPGAPPGAMPPGGMPVPPSGGVPIPPELMGV